MADPIPALQGRKTDEDFKAWKKLPHGIVTYTGSIGTRVEWQVVIALVMCGSTLWMPSTPPYLHRLHVDDFLMHACLLKTLTRLILRRAG